jgi:hypothetical protein
MKRQHEVGKLSFENNHMRLVVDGKEYVFDLKDISLRLLHASPEEREKYEISPSGYGIHWPLVDEDLSIDGLLGIQHNPAQARQPAPRGTRTTST